MKFLLLLLIVPLFASGQSLETARRFSADGNHREAANLLQPLVLSSNTDPKTTAQALELLTQSLDKLDAYGELEKALETAVEHHPQDHRVLMAAAQAYDSLWESGTFIDGKFVRDVDGDFDSSARDRIRRLQLLTTAASVSDAASPQERVEILWALYQTLTYDGRLDVSDFTKLTDIDTLPDYGVDRSFYYYGNDDHYPCDTAGKPVFFSVPASWDASKNDGERIRWLLDQISRLAPGNAPVMDAVWASMIHGPLRSSLADLSPDELRGLADDEAWTLTAAGTQRFHLPANHAFLRLERAFLLSAADEDERILPVDFDMASQRNQAMEGLHEELLARHQRPALAADLRTLLARTKDKDERDPLEFALDQITGAWGRFPGQPPQPAGKKATLQFRFRNATQVGFTARKINVTAILAETERRFTAYRESELVTEGSEPKDPLLFMRSIGTRLLLKDGDQFLAKQTLKWETDLQPAAHHEDTTTMIQTPLSESGAYFIEAMLPGGHQTRCVLWIESITLVATPVKTGMHYFVADAITGGPIKDAELKFFGFKRDWENKKQLVRHLKFTTAADGTVIAPAEKMNEYTWLVSTRLADGRETHLGFEEAPRHEDDDEPGFGRLFIVTDRPVYRPGQKVSWHAWAKRLGYDPRLNTNAFANRACHVTITGPRDDDLIEQELTADANGELGGSITLSNIAPLGKYQIAICFEGSRELSGTQTFQVEEYKKPEFAVKVEGPADPVLLGEEIEFQVKAEYYFGGAVKHAHVRYSIMREPEEGRWSVPGAWGWLYHDATPAYNHWRRRRTEVVLRGEGVMDGSGVFRMRVPTQSADQDYRYTFQAEVTDASRRVIAGSGDALASRHAFEAEVTLNRGWYATGDSGTINVNAYAADGTPIQARGTLVIFRGEERMKEFIIDLPAGTEFRHTWPKSGQYRLELALTDDKGHESKTTRKVFAHGNDIEPALADIAGLEIAVKKKEYLPGEEARMLLHTERPGSTVVLFLRGENQHAGTPVVLRMETTTAEYRVPITAADQPNLLWSAYLLHDLRKHEATGEIQVPPVQRVVKVELTTDAKTYEPRATCHARLVTRDSAGKPTKGRIVLTAYDKALEYISGGSNVKSILKHFWGWKRNASFVSQETLRSLEINVRLEDDQNYMQLPEDRVREDHLWYHGLNFDCMSHPLTGSANSSIALAPVMAAGPMEPETAVMIRSKLADSALWQEAIETKDDGTADVEFRFPDNLTTWKLKAWVMGPQAQVGEAEVELITRKDLLVRLQTPRFFVEGDEALLSAIVHNDHATTQAVNTTLGLENGTLEPVKPLSGTQAEIPTHDGKRLEWRVQAKTAGEAKIRVLAHAQAGSDAMEMVVPVRIRGAERVETQSHFLAEGDASRSWSFNVPEARRAASTSYELRYTPSLVPTILDALPPLIEYSHECAEQTLNRFVPVVVSVDLLKHLKLKHPEYTETKAGSLARTGLARLRDMIQEDSGWGWFPGGHESSAHMTATVVRGLQLARYAGLSGTDELISAGTEWLEGHEKHELEHLALPKKDRQHKPAPDDTDALVHAALVTENAADPAMRQRLYDSREGLSRQMLALLGLICHHSKEHERRDMCLRNLRQHLQQDDATQTAWLKLPADRWWCWENDPIETQAMFLRLLLVVNPADALAPRVVKYLIQNRRRTTHWNSTRDTAAVIQALTYYAKVTRETDPRMDLEFVLDGKPHSRAHFDANNLLSDDHHLVFNADDLPTGRHTLEIRKSGKGPLYATGRLTIFSQEESMPASGLDIQTQRRFFRIEDNKRTEIASDTPLHSGDLLEVELTLESKNDAEYLLVEDFKPAGFESVSVRSGWNWSGLPCYQEFRDEKVCLYIERLPHGRHTLHYLVRAETPGRFTALPCQISAMYAPELRANSTGWKARIGD